MPPAERGVSGRRESGRSPRPAGRISAPGQQRVAAEHPRRIALAQHGHPEIFALVLIDPREGRAPRERTAEVALREEYKPTEDGVPVPIPPKARADEETYQLLVRALRTPEDPRRPLARTVVELRNALPAPVAAQLVTAYNEWLESEFPDRITMAALRALEAEAAKKSATAPQ